MDQAALAEYVLAGIILITWIGDKYLAYKHNKLDRMQLADLLRKVDKHFDDKIDELKEDIEELEDIVEGRE